MERRPWSDDAAIMIARNWLTELQRCVQTVDYTRAKEIFHEDALGFGTYSGILDGREELWQSQWSNVWPHIKDFTFLLDQIRAAQSGDLIWIACPWDSLGVRPGGAEFDRPGRMTAILVRDDDNAWRAAHTHFSLYPHQAIE